MTLAAVPKPLHMLNHPPYGFADVLQCRSLQKWQRVGHEIMSEHDVAVLHIQSVRRGDIQLGEDVDRGLGRVQRRQ